MLCDILVQLCILCFVVFYIGFGAEVLGENQLFLGKHYKLRGAGQISVV